MKFPEAYRLKNVQHGFSTDEGDAFGAFRIPPQNGMREMQVIACDGSMTGWEHVSVSLIETPLKTSSWKEMCHVKDLFWEEEFCVVQFHPAKKDYINHHPGVLHLWRICGQPFPTPPKICV